MDAVILDTDILSEVLKAKNPRVSAAAQQYLSLHQRFAFSEFTLYEILRGFQASGATRALREFVDLTKRSDVFPITTSILQRSANLWAEAYRRGYPRDDADLIIASTALEHSRALVTGNTAHFAWIPGLVLADWRQP